MLSYEEVDEILTKYTNDEVSQMLKQLDLVHSVKLLKQILEHFSQSDYIDRRIRTPNFLIQFAIWQGCVRQCVDIYASLLNGEENKDRMGRTVAFFYVMKMLQEFTLEYDGTKEEFEKTFKIIEEVYRDQIKEEMKNVQLH